MPAFIGIFIVLALAFLLIFFVLKDFGVISKKQTLIVISILVILAIIIGIYSYFQSKSDKNDMILQLAFLQGKSLECDNVIVNKENFNFVSGTLSFIGKKNSAMNNMIIPLSGCKVMNPSEVLENETQNLQEELERD